MTDNVYTEKQLDNSEKMAQLISSIPEDKAAIFSTAVLAYTDGFTAGRLSSPEKAITNYEKIKEMDIKTMAAFLDNMIENGSWQLAGELEAHGITDLTTGEDECAKWLELQAE